MATFPPQPVGWPEPAVVVSTITAGLTAIIGLAVAFGLDMSDAQRNAVLFAVSPCVAVIFMVGFMIRQMVTPVAKAEAKIEEAYVAGQAGDAKPTL